MKKQFKRLNFVEKLYLKLKDIKAYKTYKFQLKEHEWKVLADSYIGDHAPLKTLQELKKLDSVTVVHSGNSGDIIYALPSLYRIYEESGKKSIFLLKLNQPHNIGQHYSHPLGQVMLNEKMAEMLNPLLESQEYIAHCTVYKNQQIDLDLDGFRRAGILLDRGDISRWCGYAIGVTPQLHKPWLEVEPNFDYQNSIVVARSERYRNPCIDYSFLSKYEKVCFVGVESEYEDIRMHIPKIKWIEVKDFLQLAKIINGCKLFIGNQSFPFSIAEGLKVKRILETYAFSPNVVPQGPNGHDFYLQSHFEELVEILYTA